MNLYYAVHLKDRKKIKRFVNLEDAIAYAEKRGTFLNHDSNKHTWTYTNNIIITGSETAKQIATRIREGTTRAVIKEFIKGRVFGAPDISDDLLIKILETEDEFQRSNIILKHKLDNPRLFPETAKLLAFYVR